MSISWFRVTWHNLAARLRRASIRRRIFLLLALNLAVIGLLAGLMWRYNAAEVQFRRNIQALLSLDRTLDQIQDDSSRLQRFIHQYLARPEAWTQAAINEFAARVDRRITESVGTYGAGDGTLEQALAAMRRLVQGFEKLVGLHPEIVATYDNTVLLAGKEVADLFAVLNSAFAAEGRTLAAPSSGMAHEAFVEAMLNLNAFQFRPDNESAAKARSSLLRVSDAVPGMKRFVRTAVQKRALEEIDERVGVILRGLERLQGMYQAREDILIWEVDKNAAALTRLVDSMLRDHEAQHVQLARQFEREQFVAMVTLMSVALALVAFGTLMGWTIVKSISEPLAELMDTVEALAGGNLEREVKGQEQPDEVGALARTLQAFKEHALARRDAENAMRELQDELSRSLAERDVILRSALVGIAYASDRNLLWVNDTFARMLGYAREELIGKPSAMHFPDRQSWEEFGAAAYPTLAAGRPYFCEQQLLRKDRTPVWFEIYGIAVDGGNPTKGTIWTSVDITGRREAAENLRIALDRQRELAELKSRFVSMASHEFRTPLTAILSSSELLRLYGDRLHASETLEIMEGIETAVRRMNSMLDDVLVMGRAQDGKIEFKPAAVRLRPFCQQLIDEVLESEIRQGRDRRTVELRVDGDPKACIDQRSVEHILANLLSNAIKYSPSGGAVEVAVSVLPGNVEFRVRDSGIGIPEEDRSHLFETFRRGKNVGSVGGTGLGLAIVKHYVEMHGGRVSVKSTVGKGSCFTVTLPQASVERGADSNFEAEAAVQLGAHPPAEP